MLKEKESFWKKKGFYTSVCVMLVGVMAVGAITYRKLNAPQNGDNKLLANIATEVPAATKAPGVDKKKQEAAQVNAPVSKNTSKKESQSKAKKAKADKRKKVAKAQKKSADTQSQKDTRQTSAATNRAKHTFNEETGLLWPVKGDVILKYSMNNSVYFKTLAQYKCNPGIVISAKVGKQVKAAADCCVTKVEKNDELGTVVTTDIGSKYLVSYGQLDNISVTRGDELKEGDVIGTIAKPTKYYTEEGSNLYFQVKENGNTVDPLLLLR